MVPPFPGMDPYLESKSIWPSFHYVLAEEIMAQLNATLSPRYYADVEVRVVLEDIDIAAVHTVYPDAGILEVAPELGSSDSSVAVAPAPIRRPVLVATPSRLRTVRVFVAEEQTLVTAIELLSPINKRGAGLRTYREKRRRLLQSSVHLIEIDLLRGGERPGWELHEPPIVTDYVLLLNRAGDVEIRTSEIWPVPLNELLPTIPVPLLYPDPDAYLDINSALRNAFVRAAYAKRINYSRPVPPPELRPEIAAWLQTEQYKKQM